MGMKEQEERIKLLEKEVALHKEVLELKKQIHELEQAREVQVPFPFISPYYRDWPYWPLVVSV